MASCGVQKKTSHPISKADGVQKEILNYGLKHINKPYRYAGKGPNAFDCSGFTSFVFKEFGYKLSTSSSGQAKQVPSINRKEDLRIGDLVFFEGRPQNGRVGHVGIVKELLPNGNFTFLHASTSYGVIISRSTEPYYATRYLHGGRVLKENNQIILAENKKKPNTDTPQNNDLIRTKQKDPKTKEPTIITAPKTITEQELSLNDNNSGLIAKNDSVIIHTRQVTIPTPKNKSENKDNEVIISKVATRTSNRGIPKPKDNGSNDLIKYTVAPGDTLYSISRLYSCSADQIKQWNPQLGNTLRAGDTLNIYK